MNRHDHASRVATTWVALGILAILTPALWASEEERLFVVTVDGKRAGNYRLTVRRAGDGAEIVSAAADIKVRFLLGVYAYTLHSVEVWKDGRLIAVTATCNDDGIKHAVNAAAAGDMLTIVVDGRVRQSRGHFLTSTGWRMPGAIPSPLLLDTEDGTETPVRIENLGPAEVRLHGQPITAWHYRLTGKDVEAEWWFDGSGRPVRQEMKWDGHPVVLQLESVRR